MKKDIHPKYMNTVVKCGCGNYLHHAQHRAGDEGRYLQRLPSLLHGQAEIRGYRRPYRKIQEQVRWLRICQPRQEKEGRPRRRAGRRRIIAVFLLICWAFDTLKPGMLLPRGCIPWAASRFLRLFISVGSPCAKSSTKNWPALKTWNGN